MRASAQGDPRGRGGVTGGELARSQTTFAQSQRFYDLIYGFKDYPAEARRLVAPRRHLEPGGVLLVEPWLEPQEWVAGRPHLLTVDEPDVKIARATVAGVEGTTSILDFHYLVVSSEGAEHFTERHEVGLFTREETTGAFEAAGLAVEHDEEGLIGRGLYIGRKPR